MLRDLRLRQREVGDERADCLFAVEQRVQDVAPVRLGDRGEEVCHGSGHIPLEEYVCQYSAAVIVSRDNERLKLIRKLHDRSWRDKLGLFFVEGEDAVEAATAEPVDLLRAGEDVEPKLLAEVATAPHPPRVIGVYRRADLPGGRSGTRRSRSGGSPTRATSAR